MTTFLVIVALVLAGLAALYLRSSASSRRSGRPGRDTGTGYGGDGGTTVDFHDQRECGHARNKDTATDGPSGDSSCGGDGDGGGD